MGTWWRGIVAFSAAWVLWSHPLAFAQADAPAMTLREALFSAGDAAPRPVTLPHRWEDTVPGYSGRATYRVPVRALPGDAMLAVYVERACSNLHVRLNGQVIGSGGPPGSRHCYRPQFFPLPPALLQADGNELRIDLDGHATGSVVSRQRAAGLSAIEVGPLEVLQSRHERQLFWNITIVQLASALLLALGLGLIALAAVRRQGGRLLWFGLYAVGWGVVSVRIFAPVLPLPHLAGEILVCTLMGATFCCVYVFLLRLVDRRWPCCERLLWAQAAATPLLLAAAAPDRLLPVAQGVYLLHASEFLVFTGFFLRTAWRERRGEFWVAGAALAAVAVMAAVELAIQGGLLRLPDVRLQHLMVPVVAATIGIHLVRQFAIALRRTEQANVELERRVAEKSREIEDSWRQIARLRATEAAQRERRRIASDLHDDLGARLLGITQASAQAQAADGERIAAMARQALDEMRLAVRGMTAEPAAAADVLADWRAECVARLEAAGLQVHWTADEPPAGQALPARVQVQCTRVLREAVSNVIRHSGATRCSVRLAWQDGGLLLEVTDDGRGLAGADSHTARRGHGLASIEGRVRALEGWHRLEDAPGGGTRLAAWVPLEMPSANIDAA